MFKELKEGQTHSFNDGCGEPEHNMTHKKDCPIAKCDSNLSSDCTCEVKPQECEHSWLYHSPSGNKLCDKCGLKESPPPKTWAEVEERFDREFGAVYSNKFRSVYTLESYAIKSFIRTAFSQMLEEIVPKESEDAKYEGGSEEFENGYNACRQQIKNNIKGLG